MVVVILIVTFLLTSSVYAEESSNAIFTNLPPDPGAAGKLTLAGIDSDNDGVRDDVQRWIVMNYPNSQKTRAVLTQRTKTMQKFLLNTNKPANAYMDAVQMDADYDCLSYINMTKSYAISREHKAIFLNNYLRFNTWQQVSGTLSGRFFDSLPFSQWKQACNFNPDAMPN